MDEDGILIQPPDNLDQMIESWLAYEGESVGYCLCAIHPSRASSRSFPGQMIIVANGRGPRADDVGLLAQGIVTRW